jgi:hypothetical protein
MVSHICSFSFKNLDRSRLRARRARGRRAAVALEFAVVALPFFTWLLFLFELSYDLFTQEALDYALHGAVRQIQTGNATNFTSGKTFIAKALCPAAKGLLECNNMWLRVTAVSTITQIAGGATVLGDYAPPTTTGAVPINASGLDLSAYTNLANANAERAGSNPYCIAAPNQAILVSLVYVGPSFIGGLLPGVLSTSFAGNTVHPTLSTAGFVTEAFPPGSTTSSSSSSAGTPPAGPCTAPVGAT